MQLKYRSISYEKSNSIPEASTQEISGVYRGVPWHKQPQNQGILPRRTVQLKYRGAEYSHLVCEAVDGNKEGARTSVFINMRCSPSDSLKQH